MRKAILIILLVLTGIICFEIIFFGVKIGNFQINSYSQIETINSEREELLNELNEKKLQEFNSKDTELKKAVEEYQNQKSEYDELVSQGKITDTSIRNSIDIYDMDFLWTTIGNYATQKGVTLQLDVAKSSTSTSISKDYIMCDLSFTVTGDYINITDFVYSIEDDDQLGFEIRNFMIEKGGENLQATFIVKNIPINNTNLSSVPTSAVTEYDETVGE